MDIYLAGFGVICGAKPDRAPGPPPLYARKSSSLRSESHTTAVGSQRLDLRIRLRALAEREMITLDVTHRSYVVGSPISPFNDLLDCRVQQLIFSACPVSLNWQPGSPVTAHTSFPSKREDLAMALRLATERRRCLRSRGVGGLTRPRRGIQPREVGDWLSVLKEMPQWPTREICRVTVYESVKTSF